MDDGSICFDDDKYQQPTSAKMWTWIRYVRTHRFAPVSTVLTDRV